MGIKLSPVLNCMVWWRPVLLFYDCFSLFVCFLFVVFVFVCVFILFVRLFVFCLVLFVVFVFECVFILFVCLFVFCLVFFGGRGCLFGFLGGRVGVGECLMWLLFFVCFFWYYIRFKGFKCWNLGSYWYKHYQGFFYLSDTKQNKASASIQTAEAKEPVKRHSPSRSNVALIIYPFEFQLETSRETIYLSWKIVRFWSEKYYIFAFINVGVPIRSI